MNSKKTRSRRGIAIIWTVLTLLIMIGFVGFGTDVGWLVLSAQKLQTGADASALAAAQLVKVDQDAARAFAVTLAADNDAAGDPIALDLNGGNDPAGDIVIGRYNQTDLTFTPQTSSPNAVKVVARRLEGGLNGGVDMVFGKAFGVDTVNIERYAIAINSGGTGAGLIVLDPSGECSLDLQGTSSSVSVSGGAVQVNSSAECAICNNGNPTIDAPTMNVVGESCFSGDFEGDLNEGVQPILDPLADLPEPSSTGPLQSVPNTNPVNLQPGWYPQGIHKNNVTINLASGIYYIGGDAANQTGGFSMDGNLFGEGVLIYMRKGALNFGTGVSSATLTPLNPVDYPSITGSDVYENVTVFQSRSNFEEATMQGFPPSVEGTFYFPVNTVHIQGGAGAVGNQLICWRLEVAGNGDLIINYTGINPAPGNRVFLVE